MKPFNPIKPHERKLSISELAWIPDDLIKSLSAITSFLRNSFEVEVWRIGLYGSWQRGDAKPDSDVDLAVFLNHEVAWFDSEKGIVNRSDALKDNLRWQDVEKQANLHRLDSRIYSVAIITPAMLTYYASHGPIHLQNWVYALKNCYLLWDAK
jgi:predicted nucleotidyltransferase